MRKNFFTETVKLVATNSTCARVQVGAILVKDKRILSIGYNGVPRGKQHCKDYFHDKFMESIKTLDPAETLSFNGYMQQPLIKEEHGKYSEVNEIHAETNCLGYAARNGIETEGCTMYLTISPCIHCAKLLIAAGITKVYFIEPYDRDIRGIEMLEQNNIICKKA